VGWLCDRIGPRRTYTGRLILGSLPIMGGGLAHDYTSFLMFRLAIGAIGASFVITQYHTSVMFAPNIVGTVNASAAMGQLRRRRDSSRHANTVRRFSEPWGPAVGGVGVWP
jgi:nitrate/nitrite transporter NarK